MWRNYTLIVICAALCNIAASKSWHGHNSHDHACHHYNNEWHTGHESSSSSSEEYDWPHYSQHGANEFNPWGWDTNQYTHPNHNWDGNNDDTQWMIIRRLTTRTSSPNQPSPSSSKPTVFPNQPSASPNAPTINPKQPTPFPSGPTVSPNQPPASPNTPTINPNQPTPFPSESTVFSSLPSISTSDNPTIDLNPTSSIPSEPSTGTSLTDVDACLRSCPVTTEYDPVCGTNYETYTNMGRFLCAQRCGVDVKIFLRRACPPLGLGQLRTTQAVCIASCSLSEEYNPVCGSDNITHDNPSTILCAQMCGYNVTIRSMTSCSEATTVQSPSLRTTTPIPYRIRTCIELCVSDTELKPVCGTNDVTYQNTNHLDCARVCGIDVEIKHRLPCGQENSNGNSNPSISNVNDQSVNPLPPTVQMCVNSCSVTAEYSPVCGTNGITYPNPSQLECDRLCGIRVEILQRSPCSQITNDNQISTTTTPSTSTTLSPMLLASCIRACPQTPEYNPVCGTNGVTYKNPSHLSCAQTCGANVDVKRRSVCPPVGVTEPPTDGQSSAPITNAPLQTTKEPTTINGNSDNVNANNNGGVNVVTNVPIQVPDVNNGNKPSDNKDVATISPVDLLSIFTDPTTTTTEADEAIDFDSRFGEDKRSKK
ncbi:hypothetical protein O3G_MSEX004235 [Manduca sexta]|uniref:Kazal-like domain-containing protein n=1 Tax=Manduca sexta TaxID=7130 RepID=A0A921YVJ8_MANSE|nr:hypothetical protein O3G_MSEX004235 [Manduca sexta]KAG6446025.1 hypothetical protein O3G_MSEX004235 [Manduca sexta]